MPVKKPTEMKSRRLSRLLCEKSENAVNRRILWEKEDQ